MSKAAQLAATLEKVDMATGIGLIEVSKECSIYFDVLDDAMCIMHDDGSVNIVDPIGEGTITVEVISAGSVLKVLAHYRPFDDVFQDKVQ